MALNAITTSGAQTIPQVGLIPSISLIVQSFLDIAGVNTPDTLFDVLSRFAPDSPGLAAAPYINALRNASVSVHMRMPAAVLMTLACAFTRSTYM